MESVLFCTPEIKQRQHKNWVGSLAQSKYLIKYSLSWWMVSSLMQFYKPWNYPLMSPFLIHLTLLAKLSPTSADFPFSVSAICRFPAFHQHSHPSGPTAAISPVLHSTRSRDSETHSGPPVLSAGWSSTDLFNTQSKHMVLMKTFQSAHLQSPLPLLLEQQANSFTQPSRPRWTTVQPRLLSPSLWVPASFYS